ncbi:N-acetyltransferase [bacterium]|nr:N-acetyltransferase [bacterium]
MVPVRTARALRDFIRVPWHVYANEPNWIPPLLVEQRHLLSKKNPFFEHARAQYWVAYRGGQAVGRITAQVDDLHIDLYQDATGHFGLLEAVDDPEVFALLLATAESWLCEQGMERVVGPFNLSINGDIGLLVDGFDTPPMFLMSHGHPYYDQRVSDLGYRKTKDVIAYLLDPTLAPPAVMLEAARRADSSGRIAIRPLRMAKLKEDLALLSEIFNDAWAQNWNFVPFTKSEFDDLGKSLKLFVPPEFVQIAEVDGRPAAMIVIVPNLGDCTRDLDGRLFPFGWARLLWRLRYHPPRSARVALMGVRREYHRSALATALAFGLINAVRQPVLDRHIDRLELSWTLEDNHPMRRIKERLGARPYKTYRLYEKSLQ